MILAAVTPGLAGDTETITAIGATSPNGTDTLSGGAVSFIATGGSLQHIPATGMASVSFAYTVTDQLGEVSSSTVQVTVANPATPVNGSIYGNSTIQGTPGADVITAYQYNNTIYDNGGNDLVNAGAGQSTVFTSSGDVVVRLAGFNNTVSGGDGNDTVSGSQGSTKVTLGNGNDVIMLGGTGNTVVLGDGTDTVSGSTGNTNITVGNGTDTISAGGNNNIITLGNGADSVTLGGYGNTVTGGLGGVSVSGSTGGTTIKLNGGANTVTAGGSNNFVTTGAGNDIITLTGSSNLVDAGLGTNMVFLSSTQETVALHYNGLDLISGFGLTANDALNLGSVLSETGINLQGNINALGNYLHVTNSGGAASLSFDPTGKFTGSQHVIAVLQNTSTSLSGLINSGDIRIQ